MDKLNFNIKLVASVIVVFLICFFFRLHYINLKQGLHVDEAASINLSNMSEHSLIVTSDGSWNFRKEIPENKKYTGRELKQMILFDNPTIVDTVNDIKELHKNNNDPPHTNLYYSILRAWFNGFDSIDNKNIIKRGLSLNLVFFCFSFFLMYKILRRLFNDNILIPFGLLAAFVNTGTISATLFLRTYEMQTTIFLLLTYVCINFYDNIKSNTLLSIKNFFIAAFVLALTLLSGYMAISFVALFGIWLIIVSLKEKQPKNILFLFGALLTSVLFAWLGYFGYFNAFFCNRSKDIHLRFQEYKYFIQGIDYLLNRYIAIMVHFIYYTPTLLLFAFIIFKKKIFKIKNQNTSIITHIIAIAAVWTLITLFLAPYQILRYIVPAFPLLALLYPYILIGFKNIEKKLYIFAFSMIFIIASIFPTPTKLEDDNYRKLNISLLSVPQIDNLFLTFDAPQKALKNSNIPIIIPANDLYRILTIISLLDDEQLYTYTNPNNFSSLEYNELYIFEYSGINYEEYFNKKIKTIKTYNLKHRNKLKRIQLYN